jgi:methylated-DNA-[protein]-cysteine S-methyltransferase
VSFPLWLVPERQRSARECDAVAPTPVGLIGLRMAGDAVTEVNFLDPGSDTKAGSGAAAKALHRLLAYFEHPQSAFDLPLELVGTRFQRRVWAALRTIPSGSVVTYGELARRLGTAPRAIGGACRANPCPILVPCHRVVATHGQGGYAGTTAGLWLEIKTWLLRHEGNTGPA